MRLRDMKKLFIALAAVALTACVKAPEKTVKVYAWQGEGENTTEQTLQADFSKWHAHGVDGMCYNLTFPFLSVFSRRKPEELLSPPCTSICAGIL